ncbi:PGAP1-like protein-domain-containing protein [Spinellus fusiger]|nr:PGAP1-like protein-domain-containing protein [Spinellus fusiger]
MLFYSCSSYSLHSIILISIILISIILSSNSSSSSSHCRYSSSHVIASPLFYPITAESLFCLLLMPSRGHYTLGTVIGLCVLAVLVLLHSFYRQHDMSRCEMSYAWPSYQPTPLLSRLDKKYTLYLYRDTWTDPHVNPYAMPVLFIPGHAGSYKQVRSIASAVAFHQGGTHLDIYTVDLNEELSALDGRLLKDQAEYMNDCIKHLLDLYATDSVVLLAHSMGGIVARTMLTLPNHPPHSVHTLITLATPHVTAPLLLDSVIERLYRLLRKHDPPTLTTMAVISIAGVSLYLLLLFLMYGQAVITEPFFGAINW